MINQRTLRDVNLSVSKALPAAGASNTSTSIDTDNVNPGRVEDYEILIELPATPALADNKTVTLKLQDSADNSSFADVTDVPAQVATGASSAGAAAITYQFKAPIGLRRYIQLSQAVQSAGGDNTAISGTLSLIF